MSVKFINQISMAETDQSCDRFKWFQGWSICNSIEACTYDFELCLFLLCRRGKKLKRRRRRPLRLWRSDNATMRPRISKIRCACRGRWMTMHRSRRTRSQGRIKKVPSLKTRVWIGERTRRRQPDSRGRGCRTRRWSCSRRSLRSLKLNPRNLKLSVWRKNRKSYAPKSLHSNASNRDLTWSEELMKRTRCDSRSRPRWQCLSGRSLSGSRNSRTQVKSRLKHSVSWRVP